MKFGLFFGSYILYPSSSSIRLKILSLPDNIIETFYVDFKSF